MRHARRTPFSTSTSAILLLLSMTGSCGSGATAQTHTPQPTGETSKPSKTILKAGGCSIHVQKRDWVQAEVEAAATTTWKTTDEGPENWLTVFPMEVSMKTAPGEWKPDVEATLNLRRDADRERSGPQVDLSDLEFIQHPNHPGGFYTQIDAETGEGVITLTRLSRTLECVVFLVGELGSHDEMADRAHELLRAVEFTRD